MLENNSNIKSVSSKSNAISDMKEEVKKNFSNKNMIQLIQSQHQDRRETQETKENGNDINIQDEKKQEEGNGKQISPHEILQTEVPLNSAAAKNLK